MKLLFLEKRILKMQFSKMNFLKQQFWNGNKFLGVKYFFLCGRKKGGGGRGEWWPESSIYWNVRVFFRVDFFIYFELGLKSGPGSCITYYYHRYWKSFWIIRSLISNFRLKKVWIWWKFHHFNKNIFGESAVVHS